MYGTLERKFTFVRKEKQLTGLFCITSHKTQKEFALERLRRRFKGFEFCKTRDESLRKAEIFEPSWTHSS